MCAIKNIAKCTQKGFQTPELHPLQGDPGATLHPLLKTPSSPSPTSQFFSTFE